MALRFVSWKGFDILVNDEKAVIYTKPNGRVVFDTLKQAFHYVNQNAERPESDWDIIKRAVKEYKNKETAYRSVYLGDDDRGISNEMGLELYYDSVYDFLKERKCLHLVFPTYYNSKDEAVA